MPSLLVKQMRFRERLKHQVQEEECNLCNKKVTVVGKLRAGIIRTAFVATVS